MDHPTSVIRLERLTEMLEEMTTGGDMSLDSDPAGDIYGWLIWINALRTLKPEDRDYQSGKPWGD